MEPDLSEFKDFTLVRATSNESYINKCTNILKLDMEKLLPIESYTFRGKDSIYWFNITFVEGRIIITGDSGDNVFVVGGTNNKLKNWLIDLDMNYASGKSKQGRDNYDRERAEKIIKDLLIENYSMGEVSSKEVMEKLDFDNINTLMESLQQHTEIYPGDINLLYWSPMQMMQYKQLVFAGKWLKQGK